MRGEIDDVSPSLLEQKTRGNLTAEARTILEHCVIRLTRSGLPLIVATTTRPDDDRVEAEARRIGVQVFRGDEEVHLTSREYALFEFLARHAGEVVGRDAISEHVWDEHYDEFSNVVDVYVQRLRRKLDLPGTPSIIRTRRGQGYQLL